MKAMKKTFAVVLALILISSSFVCFAADGEKQYYDYNSVMIIGDSQASGYTDFTYKNTEFIRIDDSYAAYVADDLGAELVPFACPGFRTVEFRYMLDDTYRPDDKYVFNKIPNTPTHEIIAKIPQLRQAIKDTDLIIAALGGNDWGSYLGWVMADVELENKLPEEYKTALREFLVKATVEDNVIEKIVEIADSLNALDELLVAIPEALNYAFASMMENWEWIVEYIYENNPDVTLVAVGLFPTTLKTAPGAPDVVLDYDPLALEAEQNIIDFGNRHMTNNQEKYGYIYVDTRGTIVEEAHPTVAGHRFIADRILEELPDARFQYSADVSIRNANYKAIEYVTLNGIMTGTADGKFSPDEAATKAVFTAGLNKITSDYKISDSDKKLNKFEAALAIFKAGNKSSFESFINTVKFAFEILTTYDNVLTRAAAAEVLYTLAKTF